ncbi:uncharacterized protein LOC121628125 [Melanotaenia boesemani]|uniref:uncharacterized protein LOC121628125 n=1 Tax=Melanotaenia boesemani TaxID=1250792 RepID=UPI001C04EF51|nr:uncharacterized protein LOC121628125 [Melanotaenia boesemani]
MKRMKMRLRLFIQLQCFLIGSLVDSSILPSAARPLSITSTAGSQAVLPCSWKTSLGEVAPSACHVQWDTPPKTIFERYGDAEWQAAEFKDRAVVPEEKLESGDCSLIIKDVQIGDTGRYESFMVVEEGRSRNTRVFIQSVKLYVTDHKSQHFHRPGEDLVLELHTPHSFRVVFQSRNSSEWSDLWMRGDENSPRLDKHPILEQLTLKKLTSSDEGTYKVIDEQGLAVSTVQLSVEENLPAFKAHQTLSNIPTDDAAKSSYSALLALSVLVSSFQILHLL